MSIRSALVAGLGLATIGAGGALAHHSSALFDGGKEVVVEGTVKDFQYTNPHSWLLVEAVDTAGKQFQWSFEAEGPSTLLRSGIKKSSLRPGDRVTVRGHPLKDGRAGGVIISVTKHDGTLLHAPMGGSAPAGPDGPMLR